MFIKSLATAVVLTSVFGVASAASLPPARCTTLINPQANQTECTYLQPREPVAGQMKSWKPFPRMMKGTEPSSCTAYFVEMQKKLGTCQIAPPWIKNLD